MIPLDDWMVMQLWEPQRNHIEVQLALPDGVDKMQDESAVFQVLKVGEEVDGRENQVHEGDIVVMYGVGSVQKLKLPSGEKVVVGRARDVAYILEPRDLTPKEAMTDGGN